MITYILMVVLPIACYVIGVVCGIESERRRRGE